ALHWRRQSPIVAAHCGDACDARDSCPIAEPCAALVAVAGDPGAGRGARLAGGRGLSDPAPATIWHLPGDATAADDRGTARRGSRPARAAGTAAGADPRGVAVCG